MVAEMWEDNPGPDTRFIVSPTPSTISRSPHLDIFHQTFITDISPRNDSSRWINIGYRVQ